MHVHVTCADGEAKFWIEPEVELAQNCGLSLTQISETLECVKSTMIYTRVLNRVGKGVKSRVVSL